MSARVFNPVIMTELTRLRSSGSIDRMTQSHSPSISAIARVRRDLFGPVDHEETRKFVEQELASQQVYDSDRWGYDFLLDMPKMGHSKYTWERISSDKVPEVYTGTRARVLHRPIPQTPVKSTSTTFLPPTNRTTDHLFSHIAGPVFTVSDILDNQMIVEATESTPLPEKQKVIVSKSRTDSVFVAHPRIQQQSPKIIVNTTATVKTQSRITDFMKSRKRPLSSITKTPTSVSKKLLDTTPNTSSTATLDATTPSPMKIARRIQLS